MKIKTKKQLILSELIEWAFENNITRRWYRANNTEGYISEVFFNFPAGLPQFSNTVDKNDTFTVEEEIEITEDTELDLIERFIGATGTICYTSNKMSIKKSLKLSPDSVTVTHYYIENDDRELVLIWRDGKLV